MLGALAATTPAAAQAPGRGAFTVSVYSGGAAFTGFQGLWIEPREPNRMPEESALRGDLSGAAAAAFGVSGTYWFGDWGIRSQLGYAASSLEVRMDEEAEALIGEHERNGSLSEFHDLGVYVADLGVAFRLPIALGPVLPYASASIGAVSYEISSAGPDHTELLGNLAAGRRIKPAVGFAAGAFVPLQMNDFALFFELSNHVTPTPVAEGSPEDGLRSRTLEARLVGRDAPQDADAPSRVGMTSNVRFVAGFAFSIGGR